ncbi:MAG TPA: hypothetical protein VL137_03010 [Polyangiaceae bacterium]|nr:hypothetical protein [Polyangiaceae bacterium]
MTPGSTSNGKHKSPAGPLTPDVIVELAHSCRQFVWAKLQIELDGTAETLPILDHYIKLARDDLRRQPEATTLLAKTVGAYFGSVLASTMDGFWRVSSADDRHWFVCARSVYLAINPMGVAHDVLHASTDHDGPSSELRLDRGEHEVVAERLHRLPAMDEEEYFTLSARVEMIEIAIAALRDHHLAKGSAEIAFEPADYVTL